MAISDSVFSSFDHKSTFSVNGPQVYGRPELVTLTLVSAKAAVALERQESLVISHVCKWSHLSRIVPNLGSQFQPLENILRTVFIPTITGRPPPNDTLHFQATGRVHPATKSRILLRVHGCPVISQNLPSNSSAGNNPL